MNEFEIAEWLVNNKHEILQKVPKNPHYDLLPDQLYDIYITQFPDVVLKTIKNQAADTFNLDPEEIQNITKPWVETLVGKEVFYPRNHL